MTISYIVQTLEELNYIHLDLMSLGEQKKQVIIANNVDELTKIVNKESKLMKQIMQCEERRIEAIGRFLEEQGNPPNPGLTVSELITFVYKASEKQALVAAHDALIETLVKLKRVNDLNQQLIGQSLQHINFTLDMIAPSEDQSTYQKPNQSNSYQKLPGIFDTRA